MAKEKMYIPFTVACGTSISNEKIKHRSKTLK